MILHSSMQIRARFHWAFAAAFAFAAALKYTWILYPFLWEGEHHHWSQWWPNIQRQCSRKHKRSMETDLKLSFLYCQIDVGFSDNIGSIRFFVQLTYNPSIISCTCHLHSFASFHKGTFLGTFDHWGCVHSSQWRYIPCRSSVEFIIPGSWIIIYK